MEIFQIWVLPRLNYLIYIFLMLLGLYGMLVKRNYMKKVIGLNILQTAIILFFISTAAKIGATIPIIANHEHHGSHAAVNAVQYINPLPHVLMLTAIVVAVATLGVALAMVIRIYQLFSTIEEDQVLLQLRRETLVADAKESFHD
ncbi:MAG: NADH-quinone oxidoreductase subunit J [Desulfobacteraceae bacterium]|nr:MAG: NADH-quinone oxidoreductase subunit J [Desulfobacteraceae bacterium]